MSGYSFSGPNMTGYNNRLTAVEDLTTSVPLGNVSGTVQVDLSQGRTFTCTITGNAVFQFINWPAGATATEPTIIAKQDATGHTVSFTGVTWLPSGTPPSFQTGPNQTNVIPFFSPDNGTTIYGQGGSATGGGFGVYGDGSDGAAVLDGTNTYSSILGKSGNTYWLLRDVYLSSLTIASGVTLQLGGGGTGTFRAFCTGTVSVASSAFITTSINTAASGATGGSNGVASSVVVGATGPNGTTGGGVTGNNVAGASGGFGGRGGNAGGGNTSGVNGVATMPTGATLPRALPFAAEMAYLTGGTKAYFPGGASGSPGAGDGTNAGGGAGAGGNPLWMAALSLANNGTIRSSGGAGAAGTGGNAGGGGGGQGGPIVLIYGSYSGSGSITSVGGNGGAAAGSGSAGASGGAGWIVRLTN